MNNNTNQDPSTLAVNTVRARTTLTFGDLIVQHAKARFAIVLSAGLEATSPSMSCAGVGYWAGLPDNISTSSHQHRAREEGATSNHHNTEQLHLQYSSVTPGFTVPGSRRSTTRESSGTNQQSSKRSSFSPATIKYPPNLHHHHRFSLTYSSFPHLCDSTTNAQLSIYLVQR